MMTAFQGWIIIAELAALAFILVRRQQPKTLQMEITKVGDGWIQGRDKYGKQYTVDISRVVTENCYPCVGNTVSFR